MSFFTDTGNSNKTVAIAKKADRTSHNVWYILQNRTADLTLWLNLYGNAEVMLTLFTSHAAGVHLPNCRRIVFFRCVLWLNDTSYSRSV